MPHFEIFVPAADANGFDVTARLAATSWTEALHVGLARMHDGADLRHVVCDIRDDGIDVTEPTSGRVFKIVETEQPTDAKPMLRPPPEALEPGYVATVKPRGLKVADPPVSRAEELLGEMFIAASGVFQHTSVKAAADFIMDLALKAVPAEGGRVLVSSINARDLYAATARGAEADARVPMGEGVVGLAAQKGVAIAVSSHELCSPAQRDGRVYGALQLVNKKGGSFTTEEINILDYLASQFAEYVIATGQTDA